jgi:WD40 repeat protein
MQDTRVQLLTDIISWAVAPASPAVFWLNGLAGTGKSTIARTICETLEEMSMLGASFFISCQVAERRHAPNVLRTVAYQLARQQPEFSNAITETLLNSPELASSESLQKLAAKLLFKPAGVLAADDRLVIVIDAMDECSEDTNGRPGGELLPILLRGLLQLSGRVKLLIASRAEPEIVRVFDQASLGSDQTMVQLHYLDGAVVRSDIRTYLSHSFANIAAASPNLTMVKWPSQEEIDVLVELSDVLFIFAASVVRFVGTAKQNPRTRLATLLANPKGRLASRIWNVVGCEEVTCLNGHTYDVCSVAFFPDGTRIVSASRDSNLRMWDAHTYKPLPGIECSGPIQAVVISPDSTRLALCESSISRATGILRLFDVSTRAELAQVKTLLGHYIPWAISFSPSGDSIVSGTGSGNVQVWSLSDLSNISTMKEHHGQVMSIAFSPDGSQMLSASMDGTVHIRPMASSEDRLSLLPGHDECVSQVIFSSDGLRLASSSLDHTVRIWDGLTGEQLALLTGHEGAVWTVAYSPDGSRLVSGSEDQNVRVWDALNFREIAVLEGHQDCINCVTFASDGTLIASCSDDRTLRLWSPSTFQELAQLQGHNERVWSVAFSPSGTRLVSVSSDETIRVWDAISFFQLAQLQAHHQDLNLLCAAFSLDGKAILTRLWDDAPSWVCNDEHDGMIVSRLTVLDD